MSAATQGSRNAASHLRVNGTLNDGRREVNSTCVDCGKHSRYRVPISRGTIFRFDRCEVCASAKWAAEQRGS